LVDGPQRVAMDDVLEPRGPGRALLQLAYGALSIGRIRAPQATGLERQESRRPTRQWRPVRPGDAALWRRRRAVSAPPLARFTPAASRRAAVSSPWSRLPELVRRGSQIASAETHAPGHFRQH
jgi:hypothetical protein